MSLFICVNFLILCGPFNLGSRELFIVVCLLGSHKPYTNFLEPSMEQMMQSNDGKAAAFWKSSAHIYRPQTSVLGFPGSLEKRVSVVVFPNVLRGLKSYFGFPITTFIFLSSTNKLFSSCPPPPKMTLFSSAILPNISLPIRILMLLYAGVCSHCSLVKYICVSLLSRGLL